MARRHYPRDWQPRDPDRRYEHGDDEFDQRSQEIARAHGRYSGSDQGEMRRRLEGVSGARYSRGAGSQGGGMQRQGEYGRRTGYLGPEDWPGPAMRGSPYPMGYGAADPARGYEGRFRGVGPKGYTRSDERIRDDVCDRLTEEPSLDASGIEVSVRDGEVTLNGMADSRADKRMAEDLAEGALGTRHVQNNLRIKDRSRDADGQSTLGRMGDDGSQRR